MSTVIALFLGLYHIHAFLTNRLPFRWPGCIAGSAEVSMAASSKPHILSIIMSLI